MEEQRNLTDLNGSNWVATFGLCASLGMLGAHRFYTGKTGSAWAMAIMTLTCCLAPITAIWWLVDTFSICLGNFTTEDGRELYERIAWLGYTYLALVCLYLLGAIAYIFMCCAFLASAAAGGASY